MQEGLLPVLKMFARDLKVHLLNFTLYLHGSQEKEKEIILDSDEPLNCQSVA